MDYAITVTLNRSLRKYSPDEQYTKSFMPLADLLHRFKKTLVYELTQNGDIHYHGIISLDVKYKNVHIRDMIIFIQNLFRGSKIFGYVCVKQVTDYNKWKEYILKDVQKSKDRLGIFPIFKDDYDLYEMKFQ